MSAPQITAGRVTGTRDQRAATDAARPRIAPIVRALARIEGPRLLRHPAFVAGVALSVFFSVMMVADNVGGAYQLLMGAGIIPLAGGTLLAANLAVLRSLRSDTTELLGPLPARPVATTLAHLLSIAWAAAAAVGFVAVAFVLTGAADGVEVDAAGRTAAPSVFELVLGFHTVSAGWHLLYLAGLVGVLVALALTRDHERRLASRIGAAGLCAVVVAGVLQIP